MTCPPDLSPSRRKVYCRNCQYDLRSISTLSCPECGRAFDPEDPDTYLPRLKQRSRWWYLFVISLSLVGVGGGGLLLGIALFPQSNLLGGFCIFAPAWWVGVPLLTVVTIAWVVTRIVKWFISRPPWSPKL